ncbi:MAG TPA: hypothetical protein VNL91_11205 [Thermoanaerobaculia bacterium]|nr:hypothetical protein [Thermoanaerobaculia bacterium]
MPEHPQFADDAILNPETHHEHSDVNVRALLWFFGIFVAFGALTHLGLWLLFKFFVQLERGNVVEPLTAIRRPADANIPPEPLLQPFPKKRASGDVILPTMNTPVTDMEAMRAAEARILGNYGWVDRQKGVVHIPIEEAKKLALQRGIFPPVRPQTPAAPAADTPQPATTGGHP